MARNAQMSRNLLDDPDDAHAEEWETEAQHEWFERLAEQSRSMVTEIEKLANAASYKPKGK